MRLMTTLFAIALSPALVLAVPPALVPATGNNPHAAPAATPAATTHHAMVVSTIDATIYTYVEVSEAGQTVWLAAPAVSLKKGDAVRYSDGTLMSNFYSKTLDRTFPSILFVSSVGLDK